MDTFSGIKMGQTQDFDADGHRWPITVVQVESVADAFKAGDKIKVTGISKGKGFAGVMKRHGVKGGPATHGQSNRARHPGSIGQTTTPGRVYKGKRMAGHMGHAQVTVRNLSVFAVKPEENLLLIRGLVPGNKKGLLKICKNY
ncbi:50S ribosomal protein L3 [Candidatus Gottesmanbacteria bacterium]|nr:50S ribosomal protein L3 [Candidatus Gottesmanbacteria bacterium]